MHSKRQIDADLLFSPLGLACQFSSLSSKNEGRVARGMVQWRDGDRGEGVRCKLVKKRGGRLYKNIEKEELILVVCSGASI